MPIGSHILLSALNWLLSNVRYFTRVKYCVVCVCAVCTCYVYDCTVFMFLSCVCVLGVCKTVGVDMLCVVWVCVGVGV